MQITEIVNSAKQTAVMAGQLLREMQSGINAKEKAPRDLVTEADLASQKLIQERLANEFPEFGFIGEEDPGGITTESTAKFQWIVDPLDGTTNYVHGLDNYCVSIGLRRENEIVAGVVHDPVRGQTFSATLGGGAFLNDQAINTSEIIKLDAALIAASFSASVGKESPEIARFIEVLVRAQALRRLGSAALNMCYVACGKLDAYWATSVKMWDVAAALLIISEAGGVTTNLEGGRVDLSKPRLVAAANTSLHRELLTVLTDI